MSKSESEKKPCIVTTADGTFRSQHDSMEQAEYNRDQANAEAEKLGIETRYVAQMR